MMKMPVNKQDNDMEIQAGPKLRNIHEEKEAPREKPKGADKRLKICAVVILALILFVGIKGSITKTSLTSKVSKQQKLLTEAQDKAHEYGIAKDDNGELVLPDTAIGDADASSLEPGSAEERNMETITSFTKLLLNWKGQSGYNEARQTLIDEWGFNEKGRLLTSFMPELKEDINANMSMSGNPTVFVLSNEDGNIAYFLICTVRNTIDGTSASGTVGIHLTINEDGTLSNVTAQTLL